MCIITKLQSATTSTRLSTCAVCWCWSNILCVERKSMGKRKGKARLVNCRHKKENKKAPAAGAK